ncbi:MAG: hypothetical protein IPQ05_03140 [Leptospiraceae bacterium]|nr:hypothetical protein [Leptospiraceae bacterium]
MKVFRKILEYSFYILVVLCFTFLLSLFNGNGRKLIFQPADYPLLTESKISPEFNQKTKSFIFGQPGAVYVKQILIYLRAATLC